MVYKYANLFFDKKKKRKLENIRPSLHFHGMKIFGKKERSLHRNGMAAIPKSEIVSFSDFYQSQILIRTKYKFLKLKWLAVIE